MAEAFGLVASIFATVQIADRVISLCKRYIESIRDAPSDLRTILVEVSAMKAVLESIKFLVICDNEHPTISNGLRGTSGPVEECLETMKSLEALFRTETAPIQGHGRSRKLKDQALFTIATLAWPFKESKARKLMQELATHKSTIGLALAADTAHLMRDTARKTAQIQDALSESQRHEVLKWLEDIDPSSLHHQAQDNYEPGTCDWTARLPEWPEFLSGKGHCLWIHGIPGAGKTILASQLIGKVEQHCEASTSERHLSIYYYCYFGHNQDESSSLLKWILNRLCRKAEAISDYLWRLFKHGSTPSITSLMTAIERALEHFDAVYITVDAIDESKPREDLLKIVRDLATDPRFHKIRLILTSREYYDIEKIIAEFSTPISMRNPFLDADIRLYTQSRLNQDKRIQGWPKELRQETLEALSLGAKGMFRWVVCQIDVLRRIRISAVREALNRLPRTLNEAYDKIFEQIPEEDLPFVNSALKWMCFEAIFRTGHKTCFQMQTLTQAVDEDIQRGNTDGMDLFHDTESLREVCGCLITVTPQALGNGHQVSSVFFAHYTVLEYLASNDRRNPDPFFSLGKDQMVLERAERVFERALCLNDDDLKEDMAVDMEEVFMAGTVPSFGSYCAYTSMDIIVGFDEFLPSESALFELALDILDPSKKHFNLLFDFWQNEGQLLDDALQSIVYKGFNARAKIEWEITPDVEIEVLVTLLLLRCLDMARQLLAKMDRHKCFQTSLDFRYEFIYFPPESIAEPFRWDWHFQGTLIDCFAALFSAVGIEVFKLLIEAGAGAFDPQGALIPFGPFHNHGHNCRDWCVLEKLLNLGANPNVGGCYITPLQIAVSSFDLEGVIALLNAGADPNAEGCTAALVWPEETAHFDFNILHGRRPLQICRQICGNEMVEHFAEWEFMETAGLEARQTVRSRMEATLLEYGATE